MNFSVCDICDEHENDVQIVDPVFQSYGARTVFSGEIVTIKCHEDNSFVKELVATAGSGKVLVVDGGGSLRRSLLGDQLAAKAVENGWEGIVINGAIRDIEVIVDLDIGVRALNVIPLKTEKLGVGTVNVSLHFAGATFTPGHYVYADQNGIVTSSKDLLAAHSRAASNLK